MDANFQLAIDQVIRRGLLPTTLSSAELVAIDASIRARALFSARVWQTELLAGLHEQITRLVAGVSPGPGQYTNPATVRLELKRMLRSMDYTPEPDKVGTIQDLSTDQRLNLIIRTQEQMATGAAQRIQSLDADTIDLWPAWELVRIEDRKEKRTWVQRWRAAGGRVFPGSPGGLPLEPGLSEGRLIALKTDPVWAALSRFGHPHPPFDFNSGVGVQDVDRDTTDALGITSPSDVVVAPEDSTPALTEDPKATPALMPAEFRSALESEGYRWDGDVLTT